MIEEIDLFGGNIVWISDLVFNNKAGKFGCLINTKPTKGIIVRESTGYRVVDFKNNTKSLCYISDKPDNGYYYYYDRERKLESLYKTEEEAIDEYNRQVYLQMDKLESFYEEQKRKLEKRIIKKKEDD